VKNDVLIIRFFYCSEQYLLLIFAGLLHRWHYFAQEFDALLVIERLPE